MYKKRILFNSEASYLGSGFAKINKELLTRLHNTGKYIVAEIANFGHWSDPRAKATPWNFYSVLPDGDKQDEQQTFNSNPYNQFGAWRIDEVVLDFKPDFVFTALDLWQTTPIYNCIFRNYFKIMNMICIDSVPIRDEFLNQIDDSDIVFGYSSWAIDELKKYNLRCKLVDGAPPGVNLQNFTPVTDRKEHKVKAGLDPNCLILGMVGRNQKRKLFPDLMKAFRLALDKLIVSNPDLAKRLYLYLHTSGVDMGYDLPNLVKENNLSRHLLFNYLCQNCKKCFVACFQDVRTHCPSCNQYAAQMPNVGAPVSEKALADIYNLMDLYVQFATNEGAGLPQIEAAACGVPVMALDHTAMSDIVRKLGGYPIKVKQLFKEVETQGFKAIPDNEHLANTIIEFFSLSEQDRRKKAVNARLGVIKHYDYSKTARKLMDYIDSVDLDENRWISPPRLHTPVTQVPNMNPTQFVPWAIANVLGEPERINSFFGKHLQRQFNVGYRTQPGTNYHVNDDSVFGHRMSINPINPDQIIQELNVMCQNRNYWESVRVGIVQRNKSAYLIAAQR